ncbi:hypothetical protein [Micromonospora aurantiaca (nom. illeg.)]|uniref:hypothetical protein n=1 Tax=Micromonospora aurantiaca (nom. illeg.) TaxID=47850 RepID=UPI0033DE5980
MLTTTIAAAAAEEPARGWGGPIALAIVAVVYIAGATLHYGWRERRGLPSPAEDGDTDTGVNAQVSPVSDTDDTDRDTKPWWGEIIDRHGRRVRVSTEPGPRDEDVDVDLGGEDEEEPTVEDVIVRLERQGLPYMEIVRHLMDGFEVSEATAKRRIREVRAAQRIG